MRLSFTSVAAVAAIFASSVAAFAADMPVKAYAPVAGYNWAGFYAGVNAGVAFGRARTSTTTTVGSYFATSSIPAITAAGDQSSTKAGFTGGLQFGYNWQANNTVFGLEADFGYMGLRASSTGGAVYPCCAPTNFTVSSTAKTDWLMTFRPRVGITSNNWLMYVTGGLAVGQVKADFNFSDTFAAVTESASISKTKAGWVVGAGIEYGMAGPWSLKLEYLHVDLGSVSGTSNNMKLGVFPSPLSTWSHSVKVTDDIVRVGLNYKFR